MTGNIDPTKEQFAAFLKIESKEPIWMLNQIRLRAQAAYPDGRAVSGAAAYQTYARESGPIFVALGGRILWSGRPEGMLIGPDSESWDIAFVAAYPDAQAMIDMIRNPDYQAAARHRTAAVADSRLIRMAPNPKGDGFGG